MRFISIILVFLFAGIQTCPAQLIKKPKLNLKNESQRLLQQLDKQDESPAETQTAYERPVESGDKKMSPPDIDKNIEEAMEALDEQAYGQARFSMESALQGIELAIGHQVLDILPKQLAGISYEEQEDEVMSAGYGFTGLVIGRKYYGEEKFVEATILNNEMTFSNVHMMVQNPSMVSYEDNEKLVTVQDQRALLEYNEYEGFTLSIPLGQSIGVSLLCVNFDSEEEVMKTADEFDFQKIKEMLGEK